MCIFCESDDDNTNLSQLTDAQILEISKCIPFSKERIPVILVAGFLGSGKTTLVNHLLNETEHTRKLCVVQNEFGNIPIDDVLIANSASFSTVVVTSSGCLCCKVNGDLVTALRTCAQVYSQQPFDGVVIEASGLSEVSPIAQSFFANPFLLKCFYLDGIVTVVSAPDVLSSLMGPSLDSKNETVLASERTQKSESDSEESSETDEDDDVDVESLLLEQIALADVIVLNKSDLCGNLDSIIQSIHAINHSASAVTCIRGVIDADRVLNLQSRLRLTEAILYRKQSEILHSGNHFHAAFGSFCLTRDEDMDELVFTDWLEETLTKYDKIFRCKGIVFFRDVPCGAIVQCVKKHIEIDYLEDKEPKTRTSRLVFIGKVADREQVIRNSWNAL